jgi:hypothetical protein
LSTQFSQEQMASGPSGSTDPSLEPGQYPSSLFGVALPQGTGAPGSPGAQPATGGQAVDFTLPTGNWQAAARPVAPQRLSGPGDSTTVPGQTTEGFSGQGPDAMASGGPHPAWREPYNHPGSTARPR